MARIEPSKVLAHSDVILPMQEPYMTQIVDGKKTYEFRKYCLQPSVKRVWFYRTAPHSSIAHICEIQPARTRNVGDAPLEEDGLGNMEFNSRDKDWVGCDFTYKILSVYIMEKPLLLKELQGNFGFKSAPRGLAYPPKSISEHVKWQEQRKVRCVTLESFLKLKHVSVELIRFIPSDGAQWFQRASIMFIPLCSIT